MKLFGTNGIRGITNETLGCNNSVKIGISIAKVLGSKSIAIAMDSRLSSDMIRSAVSSGIMSVGCNIINLGMIPTPALQYYVKTHDDVSGGVMITASHNPPEYNGIKCISADGTESSRQEEQQIEELYETEIQLAPWDKIGSETIVYDAEEQYIESILSKVDIDAIRKKKMTVCIDCANGASCSSTPRLLERMGVNVVELNATPDGMFPGHPSEPIESNLEELKKSVIHNKANLGAAHDGDADRCVFVTECGRYLTGDIGLALLSKYFVSKSKTSKIVVTTVATSSIISDVVTSCGGSTILTAVGSPIVARKMIEMGGIIGGEDNGGIIIGEHQYCRDGAMALAMMIELVAKEGPLEKLVDKLPKYHTIKLVMKCDDSIKQNILFKLVEKHSDEKINTIDGLRIDYDDGWVIIRPSGTEPKIRITSESKNVIIANKRADDFKKEFEMMVGE